MEKQKNVYSPGDDPESIEANRAYQDALAKLTQSLDQRKNRVFDPTWLAISQGFLQPGTGNFFESLGRVAGNIGKAQETQIAEDQAIAQQRLELAGRGVELQRQKGKDAMVQRILAGEDALPSPAAAKPTPSGALPSPAQADTSTSAAPQGALTQVEPVKPEKPVEPEFGVRYAPAGPAPISRENYLALSISGGTDPAEALSKWETISNNRRQFKDSGAYDVNSGMFYPANFKTVTTQIYGYPGKTFEIPEIDAFRLTNLFRTGDESGYRQLAKRLIEGFSETSGAPPDAAKAAPVAAPSSAAGAAPAASSASLAGPSAGVKSSPAAVAATNATPVASTSVAAAGAPLGAQSPDARPAPKAAGVMSREDLAAKVAREQEIQKADTQAEVEKRKTFVQKADEAPDTITTATMLRDFAKDPDAGKMTGILSNSKVSSQIATLLKEGIGTNDLRVAIPGLETAMRNAGLNPAQQAKFRVFLQTVEQMRLQMSKYAKGAVSDFEQRLFSAASVSTEDTADAVRMKADLLTRRAEFDRQAYKEWKKSKLTADEFKESDDYLRMRVAYDKQLSAIALGAKMFQSGAARPNAAAPAAVQPSPGFVQDKKTGVIRRKKEGE